MSESLTDLIAGPIERLLQRYRERSITPAEIVSHIIARAEQLQHHNIWITPPSMELTSPFLQAIEKGSVEEKPLWGVPFAVKDNIDLAGVPTSAACPEFTYQPRESATVVQRLLEAGAVPVGKTNLDQFATGLVGTRSPFGATTHPDRPQHISGGSSSGALREMC